MLSSCFQIHHIKFRHVEIKFLMAYIKTSEQATSYSKFRPSPPEALVEKVLSFLREGVEGPLNVALDVGCGSGQSTGILAPYFEKVIGIDNCIEQIEQAERKNKHENVYYRVGAAEQLEEADGSVDLVSVGMAVHWFDLEQFWGEVGRVLRPRGAVAVYGYNLPRPTVGDVSLADVVQDMIENILGKYIPEGSKLAYFEGYKGFQFSKVPFSSQQPIRFEFLSVKSNASIAELTGYISTMSGYQNYMLEHGKEKALSLLIEFESRIAERLGRQASDLDSVNLSITFPYFLLLSRKDI